MFNCGVRDPVLMYVKEADIPCKQGQNTLERNLLFKYTSGIAPKRWDYIHLLCKIFGHASSVVSRFACLEVGYTGASVVYLAALQGRQNFVA